MTERGIDARSLYLCYFGLREPLVQTQVLPYLREISAAGVRVHLLTFEPEPPNSWAGEAARAHRQRLEADGIAWRWLRYHKRPSLPATLYDILAGARLAIPLIRSEKIDIVHGRAHVGAAIGAIAKRWTGARLVFDIRGFNPEEYVDAGIWSPRGLKFRLAKKAERRILKASDGFVVLTNKAREILFPGCRDRDPAGRPIAVIPCCVDSARFRAEPRAREAMREELGIAGRRVIVYLGALGGFYLTEQMADFLAAAIHQDPRTFFLVLTQSRAALVADPLARLGVPARNYLIRGASPEDVPRWLSAADLAVSLIKPSFSKQSSSPTKIAEYLASGLPILCNSGVGDVDAVIREDGVGVLIRDLTRQSFLEALHQSGRMLQHPGIGERCRRSAQSRFDLRSVGGPAYRDLYRRVLDARS